jgi:curli biogenesis system outer membrane secretion channel CsgG
VSPKLFCEIHFENCAENKKAKLNEETSAMKKNFVLVIMLVLLFVLIPLSQISFAQGKLRVAVVRFENNSTWHWWGDRLGEAAADVFVTQLLETGKFSLIEREKVDLILREQDFGASGAVTPQTAAKIGKMLGVDLMLTGSVSQFSVSRTGASIGRIGGSVTTGKVVLQSRMINTTTGEILVAAEEDNKKNLIGARYKSANFKQNFDYGLANEVMHPAVEKMVKKIVDKAAGMTPVAHSGRIVKVEGSKVWVNLGAGSGVKVGDVFEIYRMGEELIDPDTGLSLGADEEKVGRIKITEVKGNYSLGSVESGNVQAKDFLKKR